MSVTERGLRETGAWPDRADQLAAELIAALAEAAETSRSLRSGPGCGARPPASPGSGVTSSPR
ncbi:hypothetical protein [Pseudonocardia aurantiaca]|uniref:Uncharacterized protein n=1 Tax=Pseudonocardia aurantiaca TaxID=75290 RepID=A0ABW4FU17_9PSEU